MKHQSFLLLGAVFLGLAVFAGLFFLAPTQYRIRVPFIQRAFLPSAGERVFAPAEPKTADLVFAGDIMLARVVERTILSKGSDWPFAKLGDLFTGADLVIGNFEGTVREEPRYEVTNELVFDTVPANVAVVKNAGFTDVSLANNHTDDFGKSVTEGTRQAITDAGLTPFGDPFDSGHFVDRKIVNGIRISIIGYHAFGETLEDIAAAVKNEKQIGQFVIVMPHWGVEYQATPSQYQTQEAQALVAAGADLIIGAHPHVIETVDTIDGVPVVYSLGNFLFDQDFSPETMLGLTARIVISESTIDISFVPVRIIGAQTIPITGDEVNTVLTQLGLPVDGLSVSRK